MKGCSTYPKTLTYRLFSVISRTLVGGVLPLWKGAVNVFYHHSRLDNDVISLKIIISNYKLLVWRHGRHTGKYKRFQLKEIKPDLLSGKKTFPQIIFMIILLKRHDNNVIIIHKTQDTSIYQSIYPKIMDTLQWKISTLLKYGYFWLQRIKFLIRHFQFCEVLVWDLTNNILFGCIMFPLD